MLRSLIVVLLLIGIPTAAIPVLSAGLRWNDRQQEAKRIAPDTSAVLTPSTAPQALAPTDCPVDCRKLDF